MKYRKKPVVIEAMHFTDESKEDVSIWARSIQYSVTQSYDQQNKPCLRIPTLEGEMICSLGDYLIKGVQGELYPCKPDIFDQTYEPVIEDYAESLEWSQRPDEDTITIKDYKVYYGGVEIGTIAESEITKTILNEVYVKSCIKLAQGIDWDKVPF